MLKCKTSYNLKEKCFFYQKSVSKSLFENY